MMTPLNAFDHQLRTRIVFGEGAVDRVGELARELRGQRVLLITDPGVKAAGHVERAQASLENAGISTFVFAEVRENPTTRDVDGCVASAKEHRPDLIVGLGGGSSLDTAKGCNFLLTNGGQMVDYRGVNKAAKPMLPMIAIPTTAGTGSELQSFAIIADDQTHQKMACGDHKATPAVAVLDPALTVTVPHEVTACTGIDALAHAIESFVTKNRNPLSITYSGEALRLTITNLPCVLARHGGDDLEARGQMLLGAAFAGLAIENSMLGAAHSAANPLTAHFGIVHGQAVGMMLPHVMRFNMEKPVARGIYAELAHGVRVLNGGDGDAAEALIQGVEEILDAAGLPRTLVDCGIDGASIDIEALASEAAEQWTARFNPRPIEKRDFVGLYQAIRGSV